MRWLELVGLAVLAGTLGCGGSAPPADSPEGAGPEATGAGSKGLSSADEKKSDPASGEKAREKTFTGNLRGDSAGDSFGEGGVGLAANGADGADKGDEAAPGAMGTMGHGAGTGTGQGYGSGSGKLGGSSGGKGRVSAATATTTGGGVPPEVIQRIVRQSFGQFHVCYESAMKKDPTLSGKVALKFTIDAKGTVSQAQMGDTNIADADMATCLVAAVRGLSFPAPDNGGSTVVTYPLQFSSGD
jgi:hypothetical protein